MRNAGLDESQAGVKITWRNINNLRYTNSTSLVTESEEELKNLLWGWKREWKGWLKLNIKNTGDKKKYWR